MSRAGEPPRARKSVFASGFLSRDLEPPASAPPAPVSTRGVGCRPCSIRVPVRAGHVNPEGYRRGRSADAPADRSTELAVNCSRGECWHESRLRLAIHDRLDEARSEQGRLVFNLKRVRGAFLPATTRGATISGRAFCGSPGAPPATHEFDPPGRQATRGRAWKGRIPGRNI